MGLISQVVVAETKQNSVYPGYVEANVSPGEKFDFSLTYVNQDPADLTLSTIVYALEKDANTGNYAPVVNQSLQSWLQKVPNLIAKGNAETTYKFSLDIPKDAEFKTYVPIITLIPLGADGQATAKAETRFGIGSVIYVNVLSAEDKVNGIGSSNTFEFSRFRAKYPVVLSLNNEFQVQVKNSSRYAQTPAGKYLVFANDGSVYPEFGQINPDSQRLLGGDILAENLPWDANSLDLWSKLLYTGTHRVEARIRVGNSNQYIVAKTEFFYVSGEWVMIIAVLGVISLRLAATFRRRKLQKIVGKLSKAELH